MSDFVKFDRIHEALLLGALFQAKGALVFPEKIPSLAWTPTETRDVLAPYLAAGYPLQFHPQGGISLAEPPDIWCAEEILGRCPPSPGAPTWDPVLLQQTTSTNNVARDAARRGAREGLVVAATHQTKGRGRLGREWESKPGVGLSVSLLLRPRLAVGETGRLPILASVAAADAVEALSGIRPRIKWPNDLFLDGKKLGGLLIETETSGGRVTFAVVGIGINMRQTKEDFSASVQPLATSLLLATGHLFRRADLLVALLHALVARLAQPFAEVRAAWASSSLTLGQQVTLSTSRGSQRGQAVGLDESGALQLRTPDGQIESITAGDMTAA